MSGKEDQGVRKASGGSSKSSSANSASNAPSKVRALTVQERKRPNSEVANSSAEEIQLINHHLESLSDDMRKQGERMNNLMTKNDIQDIVKSTTENIMKQMNAQIKQLVDKEVNEKCQEFTDRIDSLEFDKLQLSEQLDEANKTIQNIQKGLNDKDKIAKEAMRKANANEQYSRKNNIKIMDILEEANETEESLTRTICELLLEKTNVTLDPRNIEAIHRIPGKRGRPNPVLLKLRNGNVKTTIMKVRSTMKTVGCRLVDDVTKLNTGLINRLTLHEKIDSAWYFNGSVYGKTVTGKRHKFDLYDSIDSVIEPKTNTETTTQ